MDKEFKVVWIEDKSADWKVVTLSDNTQQYADVSINKVNKKGEAFPNFEAITLESTVRGNLWTSPSGKRYLFAPKPQVAKAGGFRTNMREVVKEKQEGIKVAQENKELGIKTSSTIRMATDLVVATLANEKIIDESIIKGKLEMWRKWFWIHWNDPDSYPPF